MSAPLSLHYHVPTFAASDCATTADRTFGEKKKRGRARASHSISQLRRGGRPRRSPQPDVPGMDREAAGPRRPGQWPEGRAELRGKRPGPAERPPRPLRLSSGPADGAPGANFTGKEEAPRQVTGYVDSRSKERLFCASACRHNRLTSLLPSPGGPSSPEEGTGTPPRPPRWPLRHEASAQPPRSSEERGGARVSRGRGCSAEWSRGRGRIRAGRKPPPCPIR